MISKRFLPYILITLAVFILSCTKTEDKAVWVVRFDLKTEDNVKEIVRESKKAGLNMIVAQVYGRSDAYYDSYIAPRAEILEDQPADYDPLAVMVKECRDNGLEIHAWVNAFYIWQGVSSDKPESYPKSEKHIVHTNPEWIIKDSTGRRIDDYTSEERKLKWIEGLYADPSNSDYREYFLSICKEIVTRYDVDGLHLDFIRYPGATFGYNERAVNDYKALYDVDPFDLTATFSTPIPKQFIARELSISARWEYYYHSLWIELKSEYITALVADLRKELDELSGPKKRIKLSAAVFPDRNAAYFSKSQDWGTWLKKGYLDMVLPMAYYGSKERVITQLYNVKKIAGDKKVLAGLGVYTKDDSAIKKEMHLIDKMNIDGYAFFSYGGMMPGAGYSKDYTDIKSVRRTIFSPRFKFASGEAALTLPPGFISGRCSAEEDPKKVNYQDEDLFSRLLILAREQELDATQKEVTKFLACLKKQFYSEDEYNDYLHRVNVSEAALKKMLAEDITVFKYITEFIYPEISFGDDELVTIPPKADYQLIYRYAHAKDSCKKWHEEKAKISRVYKKLQSGGDFASLAKEHSRSATASNGGYYKNKFYDELDDVSAIVFSLKEGEMTGVVPRPSGYGIYKLNTLEPATDMKYGAVSNAVRKLVFFNRLKETVRATGEAK